MDNAIRWTWREFYYPTAKPNSRFAALGTEVEGPDLDVGGSKGRLPRSRLLLSTAENFHFRWKMAVDFLEEVVRTAGCDDIRQYKSGMSDLIRNFMPENGDFRAWITYVPYKPRSNTAAASRGLKPKDDPPRKRFLGRRPSKIRFEDLADIPMESFMKSFVRSESSGVPEFAQLFWKRGIESDTSRMTSYEHPVFLAHPAADAESLSKGWVPAQNDLFDYDRQILNCPHLILGKYSDGHVMQFNIGMKPGTGQLTSFMYGESEEQMYLYRHPIDRELLKEAHALLND